MGFLNAGGTMGAGSFILLILALTIALAFEFVNGFHDTANAVATVIYTRSLPPRWAVIWSGLCNFAGVLLGGTAVAFGIVNLLPVDQLAETNTVPLLVMVMSLLVASLAWNFATWFLGLPVSSSHTLIGAILGVGTVHAFRDGIKIGQAINWHAAASVGLSLLISPLIGFLLASSLLWISRRLFRSPALFEPAAADQPPPGWIRAILISTCTGVSFAHGSNDGQKGIGIIMLVLIGFIPSHYLLDASARPGEIREAVQSAGEIARVVERHPIPSDILDFNASVVSADLETIQKTLAEKDSTRSLSMAEGRKVRSAILRVGEGLQVWIDRGDGTFDADEERSLRGSRLRILRLAEFAPTWVMMAVASALGLGTMVGWKRIVETVGEKIGKAHLSYAQGACAEIVAMSTIGLADIGGLPVSTTHVLSSGIAGTMVANGSGVQGKTIRNIILAWVLTLPVSAALAGGIYLACRIVVG